MFALVICDSTKTLKMLQLAFALEPDTLRAQLKDFQQYDGGFQHSPIRIIMKKLTPVVGKVFNARHLRRHHGAQNGEHLGYIVATECWVQGIAICLGITAVLGSQVPREIDEWPPLFRLAANGKAAITDTASIGESRGSCGWCYDVVLRVGTEIDCYNDHML